MDEGTGEPSPIVDKESLETGVGWSPAPFAPAPYAEVQAQSSSLLVAASVSGSQPDTAKEEKPPLPATTPALEQRGDAWFLDVEGREYRVAGLDKTIGTDALKITLRVAAVNVFTSTRWTCAATRSVVVLSSGPPRKRV